MLYIIFLEQKEVTSVLIFNCCYFAEASATTNKRKIYKASFVDSITSKQSVFTVDLFLLRQQKRTTQICFTVGVKIQKILPDF